MLLFWSTVTCAVLHACFLHFNCLLFGVHCWAGLLTSALNHSGVGQDPKGLNDISRSNYGQAIDRAYMRYAFCAEFVFLPNHRSLILCAALFYALSKAAERHFNFLRVPLHVMCHVVLTASHYSASQDMLLKR